MAFFLPIKRRPTRYAAFAACAFGLVALLAQIPIVQTPIVSSTVNLASGEKLLAPGTLAAIFGSNLASSLQQPSSVPISIFVNGLAGSVLSATPQQLTVQLPAESQPGAALLQVQNQYGRSASYPVLLGSYAPGIFTANGDLGSIWHLDGSPVTLPNPAQAGEALSLLATGLGPTNPAVPTGALAPSSPRAVTATTPSVSVDGQGAPVQQASLEPATVGRYRVFFSLPPSLSAGEHSLSLHIGGQSSNSVILPLAGQGVPAINSVVNAASFGLQGVASPGSIVAIFGLNFGQQDNLALFPGVSADGISVTFNGAPAPLLSISASVNQINVVVPTELPEFGTVNVQVLTRTGASARFSVQMTPATPGIFRIPDPSGVVKNSGAVVFANTAWLVLGGTLANALRIPINCLASGISSTSVCGQPAGPGDVLQVFSTGLGRATPGGSPGATSLPTGSVGPGSGNPLYATVDQLSVSIGGIPAAVLFSGLAPGFAGLYQVNVQVPVGVSIGDQIPISITALNGLSDTATIAINR